MRDIVWVAQEAGKLHVSQGTLFVPLVKVHVSGGLMIRGYFLDTDTLVPCSFLAETSRPNLEHEALSSLPLGEHPASVLLVDAKALQRHVLGLGCVNAVFDTQTCCLLDQLLGRFICHETKLPQLRHAIQKSKSVGGDPMPHDWVAALEPKWQRCSWLTFIIITHVDATPGMRDASLVWLWSHHTLEPNGLACRQTGHR